MAFTYSLIAETIWGNKRVQLGLITPDATTGVVNLGSKRIEHVILNFKSTTTHASNINFALNAGTTATVITGTLAITGCVANNVYSVQVVFGEA